MWLRTPTLLLDKSFVFFTYNIYLKITLNNNEYKYSFWTFGFIITYLHHSFLLAYFYHRINQGLCFVHLKLLTKNDEWMWDLKVKNKLGVSINFIILKIWSLCVARLLQKAMPYLLETFKCLNKLLFFFGNVCFG
jgi:hypothetical protein